MKQRNPLISIIIALMLSSINILASVLNINTMDVNLSENNITSIRVFDSQNEENISFIPNGDSNFTIPIYLLDSNYSFEINESVNGFNINWYYNFSDFKLYPDINHSSNFKYDINESNLTFTINFNLFEYYYFSGDLLNNDKNITSLTLFNENLFIEKNISDDTFFIPFSEVGSYELNLTTDDNLSWSYDFLSGEINSTFTNSTITLNESNQTTLNVSKNLFSDRVINGDLTLSQDWILDRNYTILGNFTMSGGKVDLNGYSLDINKNFNITNTAKLKMTNPNDLLIVDGNITFNGSASLDSSNLNSTTLTAGVIRVRGDFKQIGNYYSYSYYTYGDNSYSFYANDTHTIIFDGNTTQNIYFESPNYSQFNNLVIENNLSKGVNFNSEIKVSKDFNSSSDINSITLKGLNLSQDLNISNLTITQTNSIANSLNLNGHKLIVDNNLSIDAGELNINGGDLWIKENLSILGSAKLKMINSNDLITIDGNLTINGSASLSSSNLLSSTLTEGSIKIKGDFTQTGNYYSYSYYSYGDNLYSFYADGNHSVVFNGSSIQNITFESPDSSQFNNLIIENPISNGVIFGSEVKVSNEFNTISDIDNLTIKGLTLSQDMNISNLIISQTNSTPNALDLNGYKLTIENNLSINAGEIDINGGELYIKNNLDILGSAKLKMTNPNDLVTIDGNVTFNGSASLSSSNLLSSILTNGVIKLKGDFKQIGNYYSYSYYSYGDNLYSFYADGNHSFVFDGNSTQNIYFESPNSSQFNNLIIENNLSKGVNFNTEIKVAKEFNSSSDINNLTIKGLTLSQDMNISNLIISQTNSTPNNLNLNGYKLTVENNLSTDAGEIDINGGELYIKKNLDILGSAKLKMINSNDLVTIDGNATFNGSATLSSTNLNSSTLNNGELKIRGDFKQIGNYYSYSYYSYGDNLYSFYASGNHTTTFDGNSTQNVIFESPNSSQFNNLIIENSFKDGITLANFRVDENLTTYECANLDISNITYTNHISKECENINLNLINVDLNEANITDIKIYSNDNLIDSYVNMNSIQNGENNFSTSIYYPNNYSFEFFINIDEVNTTWFYNFSDLKLYPDINSTDFIKYIDSEANFTIDLNNLTYYNFAGEVLDNEANVTAIKLNYLNTNLAIEKNISNNIIDINFSEIGNYGISLKIDDSAYWYYDFSTENITSSPNYTFINLNDSVNLDFNFSSAKFKNSQELNLSLIDVNLNEFNVTDIRVFTPNDSLVNFYIEDFNTTIENGDNNFSIFVPYSNIEYSFEFHINEQNRDTTWYYDFEDFKLYPDLNSTSKQKEINSTNNNFTISNFREYYHFSGNLIENDNNITNLKLILKDTNLSSEANISNDTFDINFSERGEYKLNLKVNDRVYWQYNFDDKNISLTSSYIDLNESNLSVDLNCSSLNFLNIDYNVTLKLINPSKEINSITLINLRKDENISKNVINNSEVNLTLTSKNAKDNFVAIKLITNEPNEWLYGESNIYLLSNIEINSSTEFNSSFGFTFDYDLNETTKELNLITENWKDKTFFSTSTNYLNLGDIEYGSTSNNSFVIKNIGDMASDFNFILDSNSFSVSPQTCFLNIGDSCEVVVTFYPNAIGEIVTSLTIKSENMQSDITLRGNAYSNYIINNKTENDNNIVISDDGGVVLNEDIGSITITKNENGNLFEIDYKSEENLEAKAQIEVSSDGKAKSSVTLKDELGNEAKTTIEVPKGSKITLQEDGNIKQNFKSSEGVETNIITSPKGEVEIEVKTKEGKSIKFNAPIGTEVIVSKDASFSQILTTNDTKTELQGSKDGVSKVALENSDGNKIDIEIKKEALTELKSDGGVIQTIENEGVSTKIQATKRAEVKAIIVSTLGVNIELKPPKNAQVNLDENNNLVIQNSTYSTDGFINSQMVAYPNGISYIEVEITTNLRETPKKLFYSTRKNISNAKLELLIDEDTSISRKLRAINAKSGRIKASFSTRKEFLFKEENLRENQDNITIEPIEESEFEENLYFDESQELKLTKGKANIKAVFSTRSTLSQRDISDKLQSTRRSFIMPKASESVIKENSAYAINSTQNEKKIVEVKVLADSSGELKADIFSLQKENFKREKIERKKITYSVRKEFNSANIEVIDNENIRVAKSPKLKVTYSTRNTFSFKNEERAINETIITPINEAEFQEYIYENGERQIELSAGEATIIINNQVENMLIGKKYQLSSLPITIDKTKVTAIQNVDLSLAKGWNLLSTPIAIDLSDMFLLGEYDTIWSYKNDKWFKNPNIIRYEEGFWIKSTKEQSIPFEGESYSPNIKTIPTIWALIGTGEDIENILNTNVLNNYKIKEAWVYRDSEWRGTIFNNLNVIETGEGFWVKKVIPDINLTINKGWNLLSIPIEENITDTSIFGDYESIYSYKNSEWIKNPTELYISEGFWINSNEKLNLAFYGEPYKLKSDTLSSSWSLVGGLIDKFDFKSIWIYKNSEWIEIKDESELNLIKAGDGVWVMK